MGFNVPSQGTPRKERERETDRQTETERDRDRHRDASIIFQNRATV